MLFYLRFPKRFPISENDVIFPSSAGVIVLTISWFFFCVSGFSSLDRTRHSAFNDFGNVSVKDFFPPPGVALLKYLKLKITELESVFLFRTCFFLRFLHVSSWRRKSELESRKWTKFAPDPRQISLWPSLDVVSVSPDFLPWNEPNILCSTILGACQTFFQCPEGSTNFYWEITFDKRRRKFDNNLSPSFLHFFCLGRF